MIQGAIIKAIEAMKNNRLGNYITPGLSSHLIGGPNHGKVRVFEASRDTTEFITPHSHRFDFTAVVLQGTAYNTIYTPVSEKAHHDLWCCSSITQVCGLDGILKFIHLRDETPTCWWSNTTTYPVGSTYSMHHKEIHSIKFSKGTKVLMFEGPQLQDHSQMLEPWVDGKLVPTFRTEHWMFLKD